MSLACTINQDEGDGVLLPLEEDEEEELDRTVLDGNGHPSTAGTNRDSPQADPAKGPPPGGGGRRALNRPPWDPGPDKNWGARHNWKPTLSIPPAQVQTVIQRGDTWVVQ